MTQHQPASCDPGDCTCCPELFASKLPAWCGGVCCCLSPANCGRTCATGDPGCMRHTL
jgi:hypothetical protein